MKQTIAALTAVLLAAWMTDRPLAAPASCASLTSLALPNVTVTLAEEVAAGSFTPPSSGAGQAERPLNLSRAFCRVAATLRPSRDSEIAIEVWMPTTNWNQKFQAVGNGAFNGTISYPAMAAALARGYATASTDTGHVGGGARWALGRPEKVVDFGWRAVHEMTVASKEIIKAHYDARPRLSYWNGCSAGGRQAMKEAQRFPADYDGIIAGAPGSDWTGRAAQALHVASHLLRNEAARLSPAKAQVVHKAALAACDAKDGVTDGVVGDPLRCAFDPAVLTCKGPDDGSCLTAPQVDTARLLYAAQISPKGQRRIAGLFPGSELGWTDMGWTGSARATGLDQFRFIVFQDPTWDLDRFSFATDIVRADDVDDGTINALDANLKPFVDRGGKLIQYHGWSDAQISPGNSVDYYERAVKALGGAGKADPAYRLFMAPGMGHCGGGSGPNIFDMVAALEQWVEHGQAPDRIIASRSTGGAVDRTRPLCPFPRIAVYTGSGTTDDAANFVCRMP
jgi:feruloyl esterase